MPVHILNYQVQMPCRELTKLDTYQGYNNKNFQRLYVNLEF